MAPRWPAPKPGVGAPDLELLLETLLNAMVVAPLARLIGPIIGRDPSTIDTIDEIEDLFDDFFDGLGIDVDFEGLLAALRGEYTGSDPALVGIQQVASTFRSVLSGGGLINLGQLTTAPRNLLPSGSFDSGETVAEGEGWSWDDTIGRTAPGSARFVGTGDAGLLFSPAPAEVEAGKSYTARCWVSWDGVVASGPAFTPFVRWSDTSGGVLSETALPAISSPSASSSWVELAAEVTAPASARWAHLAFQVESGVLGTVWWDDAGILAAQDSLPQSIIAGLTEALEDLFDWIESLVNQLLGALGVPALGSLFDKITDLSDEIGDWLDDTQDRAAQLADLIDDLFSDPASVLGTLPQSLLSDASGWLSSSLAGKATTAALSQVEDFVDDLIAAILQAIRGIPVVGGTLADVISDLGGLKTTADTAQSTADNVHGQFSTAAAGQIVTQGMLDGMTSTLTIYTSNGYFTPPTPPSGHEIAFYIGTVYGGGYSGDKANNGVAADPLGGRSGGRYSRRISIEEMDGGQSITVGAPGASRTSAGVGNPGGTSAIGSLLTSSPGASAMPTPFGDLASSSCPGRGGDGGLVVMDGDTAYAGGGKPGGDSAGATGGVGGYSGSWFGGGSRNPGDGSPGAVYDTHTGGGGGGGGASSSQSGAPGGAPGGGGGASGARKSGSIGNSGAGGRGQVDILTVFKEVQ